MNVPKNLRGYFEQVYLPATQDRSGITLKRYATAINNLEKFKGYDPQIDRVTGKMLARFGQWCKERGISEGVVKRYKRYLRMIVRHARPGRFPKGAGFNRGSKTPYRRHSVMGYFQEHYRPASTFATSTLQGYETAIKKLCLFRGGDVTLGQVTPRLLRKFRNWLAQDMADSTAIQYAQTVSEVFKHARPSRYRAYGDQWQRQLLEAPSIRATVPPTPSLYERISRADATEGSLLWFLYSVYLIEKDLAAASAQQLEITAKAFGRWFGREVMLSELSSDPINKWLLSMIDTHAPKTIKRRRSDLLALWRYAFEVGHVDEAPRRIRKIKVPYTIPDAWTLQEMRLLLEAVERRIIYFRNGVHAGRFWRAFILTAYDTGLRLSDLLAIRYDSVSRNGILTVVQQKTGHPQVCRVRPVTLEAIAETFPPERNLVFEWPYGHSEIHRHWRSILADAGLPVHRRNGIQKLRRTSASHLEAIAPGTASWHLGHRSADLARRHYLDPQVAMSERELPPAIESADRLAAIEDR